MPSFTPPTRKMYFEPPLHRWYTHKGQSVYKKNGSFFTEEGPEWDTLAEADSLPDGDTSKTSVSGKYAWGGGRIYEVSTTVGNELSAAGYDVT